MKVLHLIDSGGLYGAEKMLLALVKAQVSHGIDVMILSAGEPGIGKKALEAEAERLGLPVRQWRMKPGLNIRESRKILKWAIAKGYDLLHSHGFKFNVLLGCYPRSFRKLPMVSTLHGYVHAPNFTKLWMYELLDRMAILQMQGVALVSHTLKKDLPHNLATSKKTVVIPNGLDVHEIKVNAQVIVDDTIRRFSEEHDQIILGVGRLSREKGFDRLIAGFHIFIRKYKNAGLIIVGEGPEYDRLARLVSQLGIERHVLMPGYCNNVPSIQRISNFQVIPSHTEGLPITLLEAMSVGVPVLSSGVGEIPIVLGHGKGGYIFDTKSSAHVIADKMSLLLNDQKVKSKSEWAMEEVSRKYSNTVMSDQYYKFYSMALGLRSVTR